MVGIFSHVFFAVLNPNLHVPGAFLETSRLCFEPSAIGRWLSDVSAERAVAIVSGIRQRKNRNRVAVVEPKRDCRLKLRLGYSRLVESQNSVRRSGVALRVWGAHGLRSHYRRC
jgi:hypothetical protein